ncbi:MAG: endonuclease [Bacillota bacterium]|nr:endonuclease [Bacillota bacterium]
MKKALKVFLIIIGAILLIAAGFIIWLSVNEYNPSEISEAKIENNEHFEEVRPYEGETISILSWNIGYAGLGQDSDFFMDGGDEVAAADRDQVSASLLGIFNTLYNCDNQSDIYILQEVDTDSSRTYNIDEKSYLGIYNTTFALNYSCPFVPYPIPPIGKVNSGLMTTTIFEIAKSERISLPCSFSWPVSAANLKRCMLVNYLPIEGSDKRLVVVNFHLEAYDDGEGKIAQTNQLKEFIQSEYEKGNYVIAGGDWNQVFPGSLDLYPNEHEDLWVPGVITDDILPDGWSFAYDASTPTCRLLNQPYDPTDTENTQYYVIDGFILSPNLELVNVETLDENFVFSDHNPVRLQVTLK